MPICEGNTQVLQPYTLTSCADKQDCVPLKQAAIAGI